VKGGKADEQLEKKRTEISCKDEFMTLNTSGKDAAGIHNLKRKEEGEGASRGTFQGRALRKR